MRFFSIIASIVLAFSIALSGERVPASVLRVIDGDTFAVFYGDNEETIRLFGIDCPEMHKNSKAKRDAKMWGVELSEIQRAGYSAMNFVSARLGVTVMLETHGRDNFGRILAYVYLSDGRNLNEMLLQYGSALSAYKHDQKDPKNLKK